jgi:hypothetical protein
MHPKKIFNFNGFLIYMQRGPLYKEVHGNLTLHYTSNSASFNTHKPHFSRGKNWTLVKGMAQKSMTSALKVS